VVEKWHDPFLQLEGKLSKTIKAMTPAARTNASRYWV